MATKNEGGAVKGEVNSAKKVKPYTVKLKKEKCDELYNELIKLMEVIESVMQAQGSPQVMHDDFTKWKNHLEEFINASNEVSELLNTPKEKGAYSEEVQKRVGKLERFKASVQRYMESEVSVNHNPKPPDSMSVIDKSSKRFGDSDRSSVSSHDHIHQLLMEEKIKRAEIQATKNALEAEQEMERRIEEMEIQAARDALEAKQEMARKMEDIRKLKLQKVKTKEDACNTRILALRECLRTEVIEEHLTSYAVHIPTRDSTAAGEAAASPSSCLVLGQRVVSPGAIPRYATAPNGPQGQALASTATRRPAAQPYIPQETAAAYTSQTQETSQDLAAAIDRLRDVLASEQDELPIREPDVFKGDVFEYRPWVYSIVRHVERRYPDAVDRLYFLDKYTAGEAKACIRDFLSLNTDQAYRDAKETLAKRYGDKVVLAKAYRDKIARWPDIKRDDGRGLRNFSDFLQSCQAAMSELSYLKVLDEADEQIKIIKKLPQELQRKWMRVAVKWIERDGSNQPQYHPPPFIKLCKFIYDEARTACSGMRREPEPNEPRPGRSSTRSHTAATASVTPQTQRVGKREVKAAAQSKTPKCLLCKDAHKLEECNKFKNMTLSERFDFVRRFSLCWSCLRWGHRVFSCRNKMKCDICQRLHPTLLHNDTKQAKAADDRTQDNVPQETDAQDENMDSAVALETETLSMDTEDECSSVDTDDDVDHLPIFPVLLHHKDNPDETCRVYAILSSGCDACLITSSVLDKLKAPCDTVKLSIKGIGGESILSSMRVDGLNMKGLQPGAKSIKLPVTYSKDIIPVEHDKIPKESTAKKWDHLKEIASQLPPYYPDAEIGLIIGGNCHDAFETLENVYCPEGHGPSAWRTPLGWAVVGDMGKDNPETNGPRHRRVKTHVVLACVVRELSSPIHQDTCEENP